MTHHTELTVRRSRQKPDKYVVCVRSTGTAIEHPKARLAPYAVDRSLWVKDSYFTDPTDAQLAIDDWRDLAQDLPRKKVPLKGLTVATVVTMADEIAKLQKEQAKRDANPYHGWHPCSGVNCNCNPAPSPFRAPSKEMLAMQTGKPAYGRK